VVSGHARTAFEPVLGSIAPNSATVVVLMGLASAPEISALLIGRGWNGTTPAAIVRGASTADAETWIGTLADLADAAEQSDSDRPGTIVVGEVVRVGAMLGDLVKESGEDDVSGLAAAR
jgi:siroheme synthase